MKTYKYETHLHTSESSRCSSSSGAELVRYFKSLGYTGVFVTDHFLNSNTTVPHDAPWPERVALLCHGYEVAAKEGAKLDLDVFFGWEYGGGWLHLITYGLGKDWLLANPDVLEWDLLSYLDRVHEDGGSIVHAHPFREGVETVQLVPTKVDAVEVLNAARSNESNRHALDFATSFDLPHVAGSDIHHAGQKRLCGVLTSRRLTDARDYVAAVKSAETVLFDDEHK
jgi:predicted metal-dependent phosphoesterase TrpH